MSRWFRVYDEVVDDPKMQRLRGDVFKALINLWCIASKNGGYLPPVEDLSWRLRMDLGRVYQLLKELHDKGFLEATEGGMSPHNWEKRQYKSDDSYQRVKKFRERKKLDEVTANETFHVTEVKRPETVTVTPPDTDTESEQNIDTTSSLALTRPTTRGSRLSKDWQPSSADAEFAQKLLPQNWQVEADKFRDYWHARAGPNGVKLDWSATWRNWIRKAAEQNPAVAEKQTYKPSVLDFSQRPKPP